MLTSVMTCMFTQPQSFGFLSIVLSKIIGLYTAAIPDEGNCFKRPCTQKSRRLMLGERASHGTGQHQRICVYGNLQKHFLITLYISSCSLIYPFQMRSLLVQSFIFLKNISFLQLVIRTCCHTSALAQSLSYKMYR